MTRWTLMAMASVGLWLAACQDAPAEPQEATSNERAGDAQTVPIYWTAPDDKGGVTIRHEMITRAQADDLKARRAAGRAAAGQGGLAAAGPPALRQAALTISSTSWSDCQFFEWLLLTSQPDGGGAIFCAKGFGSPSNDGVAIPFIPRAYDPSNVWEGLICTSPSGCFVFKECGALGPATWRWVVPGSTGGEIPVTGHALDFLIMNPPDGGPC
jgi:hypothetical protein